MTPYYFLLKMTNMILFLEQNCLNVIKKSPTYHLFKRIVLHNIVKQVDEAWVKSANV